MRSQVLQTIIIFAVMVAAFLAFYLRESVLLPTKSSSISPKKVKERVFSATFNLALDPKKTSRFGFLGEARADDSAEEPINFAVLNQLLDVMQAREVQAIFFAGNLLSGMQTESSGLVKPIDEQRVELSLQKFSTLYEGIFASKVPFYPTLGDRELQIPKSVETFIHDFHLQGALVKDGQFLYTVSAGQSFFAVITTDELSQKSQSVEQSFNPFVLEWLNGTLTEAAKTYKYLFLIGYEPAFPSTTTFSKAQTPQRDAFWKILIDHKVLAYFASKEHLFDRSNRFGVWQIITGGGGAPLSQGGGSLPFFHCLVLTIPGEDEKNPGAPAIQVIDKEDRVVEEFTLTPTHQPLYEMRISKQASLKPKMRF